MNVELIDTMGNDTRVVDAARVSFDKRASEYTDEQNEKLINYLAKHKHYSPFGHCFASFHVKAPIFVRSQLVKHEYLRMNEVSRRYVDTPPEFYVPEVWRGRPVDKKQGSSGELEYSGAINFALEDYYASSLKHYEWLLEEGVAPEQARMVLPQSMYTEWYWSGSLDAFANMTLLRLKSDAQEETRLVATQISDKLRERFPLSWKALTNG
jgi:thymidylate synthase (FAD)